MITFKEKYKENLILVKSFEFAKKVVLYTEKLEENKKFVVANQLLKSGTSLEQILKKLKMQKAKPILYTNLK